jgi:penicillin-binding protein 2
MEREKTILINLTRIAFAIIILRCFYLQVVRYSYYRELANRNCIRIIETGTPRGNIYDRNKRLLVKDAPSLNLVFVPYDLEHPEEEAEILTEIISMNKTQILQKFKARYVNPFDRVILKKKITKEEVSLIEEKALRLPGVFIQEGLVREHQLGEKTCHIVGYTGEVTEQQLQSYREKGYKSGDFVGQDGIERVYDEYLRGKAGGLQVEVDALGHQRKVLNRKMSLPGNDLILTVDHVIQEIAYDELEPMRGCVVAMDPRNGQILALVSRPGFDPADLQGYLGKKEGHPFLNRVIKGTYSPGSVFKIITELAALETGAIEEYDRVECTGYIEAAERVFHCWEEEGHGWVDINLALPYSCNIFFGTVGLKVGVSKMLEFAALFDLGHATGIDLPGEKDGHLPSRREIDALNLSIGQGPILTTPIQLLSLISTVANGGNIWKPYIVKEIVSPDGKKIKEFSPVVKKTVYVSSESIDILKRGLNNVVLFGTGGRARVPNVEVAGKTGTVQRAHRDMELGTHGLFVCYAPVDNPQISLVVFLDNASSSEAAFIAGRILKRVLVPEKEAVEELDEILDIIEEENGREVEDVEIYEEIN